MRDFNDFNGADDENVFGGENMREKDDIVAQFSALASAYEGKSESEIMKAILKEAERGRKNGTLSDDDIDNFTAMISPMLSEEQQKTLDKVVKRLKSK